jgi:hypothetical protein
MRLLLLVLLLLTPTIAQSQDTSFVEILPVDETQYRPPQVDSIVSAVNDLTSTQEAHLAKYGIYAWHPDSLVPFGLKISWHIVKTNNVGFRPTILPWNVDIIQLARRTDRALPPIWRIVLSTKRVFCWYPESAFSQLPPNVIDISDPKLVGLVCVASRTNR